MFNHLHHERIHEGTFLTYENLSEPLDGSWKSLILYKTSKNALETLKIIWPHFGDHLGISKNHEGLLMLIIIKTSKAKTSTHKRSQSAVHKLCVFFSEAVFVPHEK